MSPMTKDQRALSAKARGRPGPIRVGWYAMNGEPYHSPGCRYYPKDQRNSHGFLNADEAEAAGHPPAGCCHMHTGKTKPCPTCHGVGRVPA